MYGYWVSLTTCYMYMYMYMFHKQLCLIQFMETPKIRLCGEKSIPMIALCTVSSFSNHSWISHARNATADYSWL